MPTPSQYGFMGVDIADANLGQFQQGVLQNAMNYSSNVVLDWASPQSVEERRMAQQWINDELEPSYRMSGMKRAGINPLTAAQGISGSSPSSSPQPAASVDPIGDVAGAVSGVSGAFNSIAGGVSELGKLGSEIDNIKSDTSKNFAEIGLTNAQTQGVMTDNKYRDDDWKASLNVKRQQFENMKEEWNNIKATHQEIVKHIQEMQSTIELNGSQSDYLDSFKIQLDEQTRFLKAKNDFCLSHNLYLLESGLDGYIFSLVDSGADMSQFDRFIDVYSNYREQVSYHDSIGRFNADSETAWLRFKNQAEGTAFGELVHGKRKADLENYKAMFDTMCQLYYGSGSTETALLSKIFNLAATMFNLDVNDVRRMFYDSVNPK